MTKIVVFGANGMVGSRVVEILQDDFQFITPDQSEVNITDYKALNRFLSKEKPQTVLNFAAITDVDRCESDRENIESPIWKVNALSPKFLSSLSLKLDCFLIQISTDMVFPGSESYMGPYSENDKPGKFSDLTWYGASKAEGEKQVLFENPKNAVVRIIYPVRAPFPQKLDYARKILALYDQGKLYPMFDDQIISVTFVDELAEALKAIAKDNLAGIFHVASKDTTTPFEFASYLLHKNRNVTDIVKRSSLEEFVIGKDKRRYPQFGGLNSDLTQQKLSINFSSWKGIVDKLSSYLQTP